MRNAFTIALASALITTAAIKAAPAVAETPTAGTNVALVRTADLDLRSEAGRRQLDLRLARAARQVCGAASDADLHGKKQVRQCRADVLTEARGKRDTVLATSTGQRGAPIVVASAR
jgi:UrcA family protein